MKLQCVILCLVCAFAMANAVKIATNTEDDDVNAILAALDADQSTNLDDLDAATSLLPYAAPRKNFGGSVGFQKPASSFSVGTGGLIGGQTEVLRLLEAFLKLKGKIVSYLYVIFNDNYELIRGVANFVINQAPNLLTVTLKGIGVLRKVLEFAIRAFSDWSVALPSASLEAFHNSYAQPHDTYGLPSANVGSFLEHFSKK